MEVLYVVYQNNIYENSCGKETLSKIYDFAKAHMQFDQTKHMLQNLYFFSRTSIVRDFCDLNSIREKYMIAKFQYIYIFLNCFIAFFRDLFVFFGYFLSCVFTAVCPFAKKYMLAKIVVGHSRTIDAREKYTFYSMCVIVQSAQCSTAAVVVLLSKRTKLSFDQQKNKTTIDWCLTWEHKPSYVNIKTLDLHQQAVRWV